MSGKVKGSAQSAQPTAPWGFRGEAFGADSSGLSYLSANGILGGSCVFAGASEEDQLRSSNGAVAPLEQLAPLLLGSCQGLQDWLMGTEWPISPASAGPGWSLPLPTSTTALPSCCGVPAAAVASGTIVVCGAAPEWLPLTCCVFHCLQGHRLHQQNCPLLL